MKSKCKGLPVAGVLLGTLVSVPAHAQGLPVETGSHFPVALWALGAAVLGLVLAYGIAKNRRRTRSEAELTDRATKNLYAREDQAEHPDRPANLDDSCRKSRLTTSSCLTKLRGANLQAAMPGLTSLRSGRGGLSTPCRRESCA